MNWNQIESVEVIGHEVDIELLDDVFDISKANL